MARFIFRLQPALERARENETLARRVVVDARLAFDDARTLLAVVEARISELRAASLGARAAGAGVGARAGSFAGVEAVKIALGALHCRRLSEAERGRALLQRAREMYARASMQRGALERLRERRLLEFSLAAEAAEMVAFDEANGARANELARLRSHESAQERSISGDSAQAECPADRTARGNEADGSTLRKFSA